MLKKKKVRDLKKQKDAVSIGNLKGKRSVS